MSKKMILSGMALAMTVGLAAIPLQASAYDRLFSKIHELDADKDGMISKEEFLARAGQRYDEMMAKMMKMPADKQAKMVKNGMMSMEAFEMFWKDAIGGGH
jgi:Ca2+-binding EF-hand superfamily protein